jgi:hypothetical protein
MNNQLSVTIGSTPKPDFEHAFSLTGEKYVWSVFTKSMGFRWLKMWDVTTLPIGVTTMLLARFTTA